MLHYEISIYYNIKYIFLERDLPNFLSSLEEKIISIVIDIQAQTNSSLSIKSSKAPKNNLQNGVLLAGSL